MYQIMSKLARRHGNDILSANWHQNATCGTKMPVLYFGQIQATCVNKRWSGQVIPSSHAKVLVLGASWHENAACATKCHFFIAGRYR